MSNVPDEENLNCVSGDKPYELPFVQELSSDSASAPQPELSGDGILAAPSAQSQPEPISPVLPFLPTERSIAMHVKLEIYDGPLDLLLDLIKKNEMDIYNIQISEITRQYLQYLETLKSLDLEVAGEFIVMAATLIHIKSKTLLPQELEDESDESGEDPRNELVRKLLEYQAFKEAARELGFLQTERGKVFTRQITDYYLSDLNAEDVGIDTFSANFYDLIAAFQKVLSKHGREAMHEVYEQVVSIDEKILSIKGLLTERNTVRFFDLFSERWTKNELIATFLALLEIVRMRIAIVKQDSQFEDIVLEKREQNEFQFVAPMPGDAE